MKNQFKIYLKFSSLLALLLIITLAITNCETAEVYDDHNHISSIDKGVSIKSFGLGAIQKDYDFNEVVTQFKIDNALSSGANKFKFKGNDGSFEIDTTTIKKLENDKGTSYTFLIHRDQKEENTFENLVIEKDKEGNVKGYFIKYKTEGEWREGSHEEIKGKAYVSPFGDDIDDLLKRIENPKTAKGGFTLIQITVQYGCSCFGHMFDCYCARDVPGGTNTYFVTLSFYVPTDSGSGSGGSNIGGGSGEGDFGGGGGGGSSNIGSAVVGPDGEPLSTSADILTDVLSLTDVNQIIWLENNPNEAGQLVDFLKDNTSTEEILNLTKQAIYDLMSFTSSNYPGIDDGLPYEWWLNDGLLDNHAIFNQQAQYDQWKKLTKEEKRLSKIFPEAALKIRKNMKEAFDETFRRYGNVKENLNGKPDAFRHAYFNAINTRDTNAEVTLLFSNAHESEVPIRWDLERQMDLYNNIVGIAIGDVFLENTANSIISTDVFLALIDGELRYLSPINYSDPNFRDNPNTPEPNDGTHGITTNTRLIPTNE